jgi:hypothetical protein
MACKTKYVPYLSIFRSPGKQKEIPKYLEEPRMGRSYPNAA